MEKIISITDKRWVFRILASFAGCLALTLCLNISSRRPNFWSAEQALSLSDGQVNKTASLSFRNSSFESNATADIKTRRPISALSAYGKIKVTSLGDRQPSDSSFTDSNSALQNAKPCELRPPQARNSSPDADVEGPRNDAVRMNSQDKTQSCNSTEERTNPQKIEDQAGCNIMDGVWAYDDSKKSSPMYTGRQCPFLSDQVSCQRNGRSDSDYEKWSWEAKGCQIPQFNGTDMLERLRGKRVVIAGDSLNRNQWESLACLLYSSIPPSRAHVDYKSSVYKIFRAKDFDCSVEFFWAPFLIELQVNPGNGQRILRLDRLTDAVKQWKGADVMVFNTGHWWVHSGKSRAWDLFQHKGKLSLDMATVSAFEIAMKTWARWIDKNVDVNKTRVYFRSISPEHKGAAWCYNQTEPIRNESFAYDFPRPLLDIISTTLNQMKTPVRYLNITKLSEYRRDAHPSIYARSKGKLLIKTNDKEEPEYKGDCSHWCLPGVPDTWNRLIYAHMVTPEFNAASGLS
uniref:Trichome birefringence-like N-terminal domain-containing protein n=1 Tax=Kalanchoe fedtschenkoi TaxID=63787 RepID=A0A7N0V4E7_KALFE